MNLIWSALTTSAKTNRMETAASAYVCARIFAIALCAFSKTFFLLFSVLFYLFLRNVRWMCVAEGLESADWLNDWMAGSYCHSWEGGRLWVECQANYVLSIANKWLRRHYDSPETSNKYRKITIETTERRWSLKLVYHVLACIVLQFMGT